VVVALCTPWPRLARWMGTAVDAPCGAGWGVVRRKIGASVVEDWAWRRGRAGGRTAHRVYCGRTAHRAVTAAPRADDTMKVVAVASEENIQG
jgi:hypothetical protein